MKCWSNIPCCRSSADNRFVWPNSLYCDIVFMEKLKEILLKFFKLDSIVGNLTGYVESRVALVKMEIREEVASVLSRALIIIVMFLIGFLVVLFLSVGLAE